VTHPLILNERSAAGKKCLRRGVDLFRHLLDLANRGEAVGVSYAQFVCLLHGVQHYQQVTRRKYFRADTPLILRLSAQVTEAAGGSQPIAWDGVTIVVGMDTFIWRQDRPYPRPRSAFSGSPYTETEWKKVFPDGLRRLMKSEECVPEAL
jgi:hypothetical protein